MVIAGVELVARLRLSIDSEASIMWEQCDAEEANGSINCENNEKFNWLCVQCLRCVVSNDHDMTTDVEIHED